MKNSKKTVRGILVGALALAMGMTVLFAGAGNSYAAGEASLNAKSFNILTRRAFDLDVADAPEGAVITWKSSNPEVAVVDDLGVVTGITKGEAKIVCEVTAAGKTQKLTATAKVRKPAVKIEIINKIDTLKWGKEYDLNRALTPNKSNDVTTWTSSDESIATVDKNGVVEALDDGVVTITATTMSGKTDSVEITVYGAPEPTPTPAPTATPEPTPEPGVTVTPKPTQAPKATEAPKPTEAPKATATPKPAASKVLYSENFEKGQGKFGSHHGAALTVKKSASAKDGTQFLQVTGRTATYQGANIDVNSMLKLGGTYKLTAYVKQTANDSEVIKATYCKNGGTYDQIGTVTAAKNEWVEISGEFTIDADTTDYVVYFETDTTIDFMVDKVTITELKAGTKLIVEPVDMSKAITYNVADLQAAGWGQTNKVEGGVSKVSYGKQYDEVQYVLPQPLTVGDLSEIIINMSSTDKVGVKLWYQGAELIFWWNKGGNPELADVALPYGKTGYGESTPIPADILAKQFDAIGIMAMNGACEATVKSISLIPKQ